ncbi:MAG: GntR family transcriptional regulator [Acidimicrobiales bacterium]
MAARPLGSALVTPSTLASFAWSIEPSSEVSVRQQTIHTLRQAIKSFQLRPGQRLVERELIDLLGVSRTTLREALRELAAEGLVTVVPQKGARVSAPTVEEASDLYEVRAVLESLLVSRFVKYSTEDEVAALSEAVEDYELATQRTTDTVELLTAKEQFYEVLIRGSHSATLEQLLEGIRARVQGLRATSLSRPGRADETVAELRAIAVAVLARDADLAAARMAEHVRAAGRTALSRLTETDVSAGD